MRILHVIPAFLPSRGYGGGPSIAYKICRLLVSRGHEVTVFTTDANDGDTRLASGISRIDGMTVHVFKNISNRIAYRNKFFFAPLMIPSLRRIADHIELVHLHDLRTSLAVLVEYFSRGRYPYIVQAHGVIPIRSGGMALPKNIFDMIWGRGIIKNASGDVALNDDEANAYTRMGANPDRVTIIPNGIDLAEYQNLPPKGCFRKRHDLVGYPLVLYIGRIHESKRIDLLIKTFASLPTPLEDAKLVIAGPDDGALRSIKHLSSTLGIEERVLFIGFLDGREKMEAYTDADVFVTPRFTGFPLTFLESMACGLPILATNRGDVIKEIDGRAGLITSYGNEEFRDAMIRILTDSTLQAQLRFGARQLVLQYDWGILIGMFEELYRKIRSSK